MTTGPLTEHIPRAAASNDSGVVGGAEAAALRGVDLRVLKVQYAQGGVGRQGLGHGA
eukprot:SAG31_NODE_44693_length_261_cov_2.530864_1_plen_56_part_01